MTGAVRDIRLMLASERLEEWAQNLHYPGFSTWPSENLFQRLRTDRRNAAAGAQSSPVDVIDGVPCRKDGGAAAMVARMAKSIDRSRRVREVAEAMQQLPEEAVVLIVATYVRYSPREDARTAEQASLKIGISRATYFRRKERVLQLVADYLALSAGTPEKAPYLVA